MSTWSWRLLLCALLSISELVAPASGAQCPITEVKEYAYHCGVEGYIRKPSLLRLQKDTATQKACAVACLDEPKCHAMRFIKEQAKCYLYRKYLDGMFTSYTIFEPGLIWNRYCWSTDCNIIDACRTEWRHKYIGVTDSHDNVYEYYRYACSYGKTASSRGHGHQLEVAGVEIYNATYKTLQAFKECAGNLNNGSFDVHFHLPSQQWVCILYADDMSSSAFPSLAAESISRHRYTVHNETVGAGYGWFLFDRPVR